MPVDIVISTDQNRYNTTGSITASASSYDSAVPTTTAPSTTAQSFVLPNNPGDKPSLLRLTRSPASVIVSVASVPTEVADTASTYARPLDLYHNAISTPLSA